MMPRQLPFRTSPALSKVIVGLICAITVADALAADGLRELDLSLKSLVYDPFTQKLYGTATNSLLQIDPASGQILQSFTLGTNLSRLELGSARGLWVAIQGEQAVRRFDLETLSAGEKIAIFGPVFDIAPSPSEPFTVAVSTFAPAVLPKTAVIKNGTLLPDQPRPYNGSGFLAMQGDFVYEHLDLSPYAANVAALLRMRIGPNGLFLESPLPVVGLGGFGRIQIQGTNLYSATGAVFDTPSLATLPGYSPAAGRARTFAINNEAGSIFFLSLAGSSATESSWILDRFDLVSHDLTGRLYLPPLDPYTLSQRADSVAWNLVTWSTNRLAFQTLTKLCLLESEKIFLPADVQVSQSLPPATIPFGAPVNVTVTVTNNGPGTALNVTVTNFTSQAIYLGNNSGAGSNQFVVNLGPLPPNAASSFTIAALPAMPGVFNVQSVVSSSGETNLANNTNIVTTQVTLPDSPVTLLQLGFVAREIAFDPVTQELLFPDPSGTLWRFNPSAHRFDSPLPLGLLTVSVPRPSGFFYSHTVNRSMVRGDTRSFQTEVVTSPQFSNLIDTDSSPADAVLVALANDYGTYLYKNGASLPNGFPVGGYLRFSEDGSKLIFVNPNTCVLEFYKVDQNGFTFESHGADAACSRFAVANGLVYFDSGLIYDAATGQKSTNRINLTPPSFVLPRTNGLVDVLSRTNGIWIARRLIQGTQGNQGSFQQIRAVAIPDLSGTPLKIVEAGTDLLAIATSSQPVLVNLGDPATLAAYISLNSSGQLTLIFDSENGATYRIDHSPTLSPVNWTALKTGISGTGAQVEQPLSTNENAAAFYRLVRLP